MSHSILNLSITDSDELLEAILRNNIEKPLYRTYEENLKYGKSEECKGENKLEVKVMKESWKNANLSSETINYLIDQIISTIKKITTDGTLKIRSIELMYYLSQV